MPIPIASPFQRAVQPVRRRVFDRRAAAFEKVAFLPREIAARMRERLDYIKTAPAHILDAGCGTGADLVALGARYPAAQVTGIDGAHAMLVRAGRADKRAPDGLFDTRRWLPDALRRVLGHRPAWRVQSDFSAMPFADGAFDMLWSNLALQWHPRPDAVFPEWQRVLATGGLLMFSTLGPDTLKELRAAWLEAETGRTAAHVTASDAPSLAAAPRTGRRPPMLDFVDMHDFGDMLVASGFELPVMDMETLSVTYRDPVALLADVRAWGAVAGRGTALDDAGAADAREAMAPAGLTGRLAHRRLLDAIERQRNADGLIALTFEIVYGHAWKAQPRAGADGRAIVRVEDIGGRRSPRNPRGTG
ncbi:MAG: methyltransferase domain-containing protein [Janthinobacterium lividum]